jgi:hypothetical protein
MTLMGGSQLELFTQNFYMHLFPAFIGALSGAITAATI